MKRMDPEKEIDYQLKYSQCLQCRRRHDNCAGGCPPHPRVETIAPGQAIITLWEDLQILKFNYGRDP